MDTTETTTIPAHATAEVTCGACGLLLVVTTTAMGMNSEDGTSGHVCNGVLAPPLVLKVSVKPSTSTEGEASV